MKSGKVIWSQQIYKDDSFIVGCSGAQFTENCPKFVGPDWEVPMSPMLKTLSDGRAVMVFGTKPGDLMALDLAKQGETVWRVSAVNADPVSRPGAPNRGRRRARAVVFATTRPAA